jgi:phenylpropionate dioxygenase-like ring-hydroxylating dioxygenase large terminal subunit
MTALKTHNARVDVLLEEMRDDLAAGMVPIQVFNNQEIYEQELRRIFARSWVFIGHETELPNPGDYAARNIGEDPFIFVRGDDGELRVLFNACRHRGVQICRASMGNTDEFMCPYHGWTYRNDGTLIGVPARSQGYRKLNLDDWGLFEAPHVANYHGLVFACLDPDAIPFEEYLGDYRWYLDVQFLLSDGGMEIVGDPHRWQVNANWKQGAENFCGDSSHTQIVHKSALESGAASSDAVAAPDKSGLHVHDCDGFAISTRLAGPGNSVFWGYPEEVTRHFNQNRLNADQFDFARRGIVHDGTVFPNFSYLHLAVSDSAERDSAGFLTIRVWQPIAPGRTEIWAWILAPKEASAAYKARAYEVGMSSFSPSGSFEQDDTAVWPGIARSARTVFAEMNDIKLNYQMGMGEMNDSPHLTDWPGPGVAEASNAGEGGLRTFHNTWLRQMLKHA